MEITVKSIEAVLLDTSTKEESNFAIDHWKVAYRVNIGPFHTFEGTIKYREVTLVPSQLIQHIESMYTLVAQAIEYEKQKENSSNS